jgi:poly(beta-D-mannuronate) lyase
VKLSIVGATASTHDGNVPANAIDGSLATRWSANGDPQWLKLDLGSTQTVSLVKVAVYSGNTRANKFELQLSTDDVGWTTAFSGQSAGTTTALQTFDLDDHPARWVRYLGHGNTDATKGTWNSLSEVEVWGNACTGCPTATPTPTPTFTPIAPTATPTPTPTPTVPGGECTRTINVSTSAQLAAAASGALPGDCVLVADGSYAAFTVTADGTSASPILIKAVNRGGATISSGITRVQNAHFVTLEGFRVTSSGGNTTLDGVSRNVIVSIADSSDCRITRFNFKPSGHANNTGFVMLNGNSHRNRVDHSDFGPNSVDGVHYVWPTGNPEIPGVTKPADRTPWAEGHGPFNPNMARETQIDHNYFHDQAAGTAECIVLGGIGMTGDYQDLNTVVEYNLFTNCDGDPEIVSIKSSSNTVRYNTIRTSVGGIVNRAGNKAQIYGNFILQGGKSGSVGIRFYEKDHTIYDNYIENTSDYAVIFGGGDAYGGGSFAHAQVFRARFVHNTMVAINGRPVIIGHGSPLPPTDCVFANNILQGNATLMANNRSQNMTWSQNIYQGNLGWSPSSTSWFLNANPLFARVGELLKLTSGSPAIGYANPSFYPFVVEDLDGQERVDPDAGADEFSTGGVLRRPLVTTDVGPNAP